MSVVSVQQLLEAGVHFGHYTKRWDPRMKKYIYTSRNGIYIIDLQKTAVLIEEAYKAMFEIAKAGGKVLFVGTKKQAQEAVKETAIKTKQYYVDFRWLGGILTNFKTIRKRIAYLEKLENLEKTGEIKKYPKKEIQDLLRQKAKLEMNLSGIKKMEKLPQALFIVDPRKEEHAIREAKKLNIPVFGIVDTNCNPENVDYVIPANDDAIKSVKLIVSVMGNSIIEANGGIVEKFDDQEALEIKKVVKPESAEIKKKEVKPATKSSEDKKEASKKQETKKPAEKKETAKKPEAKLATAPKKQEAKPAVKKAEVKTAPKKEASKKTETKKPAEKKEIKPVAKKVASKKATK